jgi:hypothetical protein
MRWLWLVRRRHSRQGQPLGEGAGTWRAVLWRQDGAAGRALAVCIWVGGHYWLPLRRHCCPWVGIMLCGGSLSAQGPCRVRPCTCGLRSSSSPQKLTSHLPRVHPLRTAAKCETSQRASTRRPGMTHELTALGPVSTSVSVPCLSQSETDPRRFGQRQRYCRVRSTVFDLSAQLCRPWYVIPPGLHCGRWPLGVVLHVTGWLRVGCEFAARV